MLVGRTVHETDLVDVHISQRGSGQPWLYSYPIVALRASPSTTVIAVRSCRLVRTVRRYPPPPISAKGVLTARHLLGFRDLRCPLRCAEELWPRVQPSPGRISGSRRARRHRQPPQRRHLRQLLLRHALVPARRRTFAALRLNPSHCRTFDVVGLLRREILALPRKYAVDCASRPALSSCPPTFTAPNPISAFFGSFRCHPFHCAGEPRGLGAQCAQRTRRQLHRFRSVRVAHLYAGPRRPPDQSQSPQTQHRWHCSPGRCSPRDAFSRSGPRPTCGCNPMPCQSPTEVVGRVSSRTTVEPSTFAPRRRTAGHGVSGTSRHASGARNSALSPGRAL